MTLYCLEKEIRNILRNRKSSSLAPKLYIYVRLGSSKLFMFIDFIILNACILYLFIWFLTCYYKFLIILIFHLFMYDCNLVLLNNSDSARLNFKLGLYSAAGFHLLHLIYFMRRVSIVIGKKQHNLNFVWHSVPLNICPIKVKLRHQSKPAICENISGEHNDSFFWKCARRKWDLCDFIDFLGSFFLGPPLLLSS